jgi:hypothetical protein
LLLNCKIQSRWGSAEHHFGIAVLDTILWLYKKREKERDKEIEEDFYGVHSLMAAWSACTLARTLEKFICSHKDVENMRNNGTFEIIS